MARAKDLAIIIPTAGRRLPLLKELCKRLSDNSVGQIVVMDNSGFGVHKELSTAQTKVLPYIMPFN